MRIIMIYVQTLQPDHYLARSGESVSRLSDTNVQTELTDLEIPHGVLCLSIGHYQALDFYLK